MSGRKLYWHPLCSWQPWAQLRCFHLPSQPRYSEEGWASKSVSGWTGSGEAHGTNASLVACYAAGDCGLWLHPSKWCPDLRTGDSIGEVYFRLGNPSKVEGNTYTWLDGKPDPAAFTAIIENGILTSVNCL